MSEYPKVLPPKTLECSACCEQVEECFQFYSQVVCTECLEYLKGKRAAKQKIAAEKETAKKQESYCQGKKIIFTRLL